jgi:hypothetical protein
VQEKSAPQPEDASGPAGSVMCCDHRASPPPAKGAWPIAENAPGKARAKLPDCGPWLNASLRKTRRMRVLAGLRSAKSSAASHAFSRAPAASAFQRHGDVAFPHTARTFKAGDSDRGGWHNTIEFKPFDGGFTEWHHPGPTDARPLRCGIHDAQCYACDATGLSIKSGWLLP